MSSKSEKIRNWIFPPIGWRFLIIIVLGLGIFFRFVNLDQKVYWFDEAMTIAKISGYADEAEVFNGQTITSQDLHKYQHPNPKVSVVDIVKNLSVFDPKHTPLYFVMIRFWVQWFGSSVAITRILSAIISLLVFPCLYWLCLELFQSSLIAWIAIALLAVSPFHILYAQEARMYSCLTVFIVLSSAVLLRARRINTKLGWVLYSVSLLLGFYTHTLFMLVAISHCLYIALTQGFRLSKIVIFYLTFSLIGVIAFTPWVFFIVTNSKKVSSSMEWATQTLPLSSLVQWWHINLSRIFLDLNPEYRIDTDFSSFNNPLLISLRAIFLLLVSYSIYFICRNSLKQIWLFIITLMGVTSLSLAIPDLLFGGIRSNNVRYLIPVYMAIHLAVAYLFATKLTSIDTTKWQQKLWQIGMIGVISCGVVSCVVSSQAEVWWNKYYSSEIPPIASIVNQAKSPLLIIDSDWQARANVWSISYFLNPTVKLQLLVEGDEFKIPDISNNIFLFNPSQNLINRLGKEQNFKVKPLYQEKMSLWKLD